MIMWLETLARDIRYGLRQLLKTPVFPTVALAIVAARSIKSFLFGVQTLDPLAIGTAVLLIGALGALSPDICQRGEPRKRESAAKNARAAN